MTATLSAGKLTRERIALLHHVVAEVRKSPLQVTFGAISALGGITALWLSWESNGRSFQTTTVPTNVTGTEYLIVIAAFAAFSFAGAISANFLRRVSWSASFFGSLLIATICVFLTTLMAALQGVRFGNSASRDAETHSIIYWGVCVMFAAVNGQQVMRDLVAYGKATADAESKGMTHGEMLIFSAIWLAGVKFASSMLSGGLLN